MTTVCLRAKTSNETDTWSGIFTDFSTETESCLFIKQLTTICISNILYLRKVLPDDYFESKSFEGITLKLLKSSRTQTSVCKVQQWLKGAFEALEKKYLKRLMLDIKDTESEKTLEIYTITFNYSKEKGMLNFLKPAADAKNSEATIPNTKLNTIRLLQMCYAVTQTYNSLPTKIKISMRLSYYDYVPRNYQPSGYVALEFAEPKFPAQTKSIEIGVTETQHHFFKFIHKSCLNERFFKLQDIDCETENDSNNSPVERNKESDQIQTNTQKRQTKVQKELCYDNVTKSPETDLIVFPTKKPENIYQAFEDPTEHKRLYSKTDVCEAANITKNALNELIKKGKLQIRCPCLSTEKSSEMFQCLSCKFVVHAECFGILQLDPSKKIRFYCHLCHQKQVNSRCHDKVMISLNNSSDQQKLSLLRRVLRYCTMPSVKKITLKKMEKIAGKACPKTVVKVVLNKMIEVEVVTPQDKKKQLLIHKEKLAEQMRHYFYKVQRSNHNQTEESNYNYKPENKRKNDFDDFNRHRKNIQPNAALQEFINLDSQTSEQSFDIFS